MDESSIWGSHRVQVIALFRFIHVWKYTKHKEDTSLSNLFNSESNWMHTISTSHHILLFVKQRHIWRKSLVRLVFFFFYKYGTNNKILFKKWQIITEYIQKHKQLLNQTSSICTLLQARYPFQHHFHIDFDCSGLHQRPGTNPSKYYRMGVCTSVEENVLQL